MLRSAAALALLALLPVSAARAQATLPSPESVLGHRVGADYKVATYDETIAYFQKLDAASDRLTMMAAGKSTGGRTFWLAAISSAGNLRKLDRYREIARRLARPADLGEAEARQLAREGRVLVHIDGGLHATEVAGPQHTMQLAYDLLAKADDPEYAHIFENVILLLWPTINPDGQQMVAEWYRGNVGTPFEVAPLPRLYQEYVGHDNNRDGYMLNMIESRVMEHAWRQWEPQIIHVHHQSSPFPTRIWLPPFAEPIGSQAPYLISREINMIGMAMAKGLEERGQVGATHMGTGFDAWYPGYIDYKPVFQNIASYWTETALYSYGTPRFYTLNDFPQNMRDLRPQTLYPSPWPGGWWRVRDIVEQQKIAAWATVDLAARNRETVLWNMYLKASRQTARGADGEVKAYVVPAAQHDPLTAQKLVNMLLDSGVDVGRAPAQFIADDRVFGAGSFVVPMAQPKHGLVRWMLGRTSYPDNTYTREANGDPIRPYDMATDTFAEFMGVRVEPVTTPVTASLERLSARLAPAGTVAAGASRGWVLDGRLNDTHRVVHLALARGLDVRRAAARSPDGSVRAGDFLIAAGDVASIATLTGVSFDAAPDPLPEAYAIRRPRIAMYQRYGGGNMDEGWTRLLLERFDIPYKTVMDAEIKAGALESKFDVIILPADSVQGMTGEAPAAGSRGGFPFMPANVPPEYKSGFGAEGVTALEGFVKKGGTLLAFAQAADLPVQRFNLPVRNVVAGVPSKEFWAPGSTLRVRFAAGHPLVQGMPAEGCVLFMPGSQAYEVTSTDRSQDVDILATFVDRDLLQSGWLIGERTIARKAAAVSVKHGAGRVVLLGFRAQNRAQTHGTFKMVFNALLNGPGAR